MAVTPGTQSVSHCYSQANVSFYGNKIVKLLTQETILTIRGQSQDYSSQPAASCHTPQMGGVCKERGTKILDIWTNRTNNDRLFVKIA